MAGRLPAEGARNVVLKEVRDVVLEELWNVLLERLPRIVKKIRVRSGNAASCKRETQHT
jgi:hypothetical protein